MNNIQIFNSEFGEVRTALIVKVGLKNPGSLLPR